MVWGVTLSYTHRLIPKNPINNPLTHNFPLSASVTPFLNRCTAALEDPEAFKPQSVGHAGLAGEKEKRHKNHVELGFRRLRVG